MNSPTAMTWPKHWIENGHKAAARAVLYKYRNAPNVESLADDATMQALVEALVKGRKYFKDEEDGRHFVRFCCQRATWRAAQFLRSQRIRSRRERSLATLSDEEGNDAVRSRVATLDEAAMRREEQERIRPDRERIRQCVSRLSAKEQSTVWMKYRDGQTDASIAERHLGRPPTDAERQAARKTRIAAEQRIAELLTEGLQGRSSQPGRRCRA